MVWDGQYYFDKVLPFGLRSSPALFNLLADALCWILRHNYSLADLEHYLDDYIGVAPPSPSPSSSTAAIQQATLLTVFENLGVPVATGHDKVVPPTTVMTVLGIEVDSVEQVTRFPQDKLSALHTALATWLQRTDCSKRELLSLIGTLSFAAKVVPPGRTFIRRLIDLSTTASSMSARIPIDEEARLDIVWWHRFAADWNGKSFFLHPQWTPSPDMQLFTDASGSVGWGAYNHGRWIRGTWSEKDAERSIEWKELYAILVACSTWGYEWSKLRILFHCDNSAVVDCIRSGCCKSPPVMSLLRELFFVSARCNFAVSAVHIAGHHNVIADCLSRSFMQAFRRHAPNAKAAPDIARLP
eukprot:scpid57113/ scgid4981/ 